MKKFLSAILSLCALSALAVVEPISMRTTNGNAYGATFYGSTTINGNGLNVNYLTADQLAHFSGGFDVGGGNAAMDQDGTVHGNVFVGGGDGLTDLNASQLTTGNVPPDRLGTGSALQVVRRNAGNNALEYATISGGTFTNVTVIQTNATTAQIQAAFDGGGAVWFTPSIYPYSVTNLTLTKGLVIYGNGATLQRASLSITNALISSGTNTLNAPVIVKDLNFDGGVRSNFYGAPAYYSTLNGSPDPYYNPYWSNSAGLYLSSSSGGLISGCSFYGWPGNGVVLVDPDMSGTTGNSYGFKRILFQNNIVYSNFVGVLLVGPAFQAPAYYNTASGLWKVAAAEYTQLQNNEIFKNYMGVSATPANCLIQGNTITANQIGAFIGYAPNAAHGLYQGNVINHNTQYGLWMESNNGGQIKGNNFLANGTNSLVINSCTELQIEANWFGSTDRVTITNVSTGFFRNNAYQGTWTAWAANITNAVARYGNVSSTVAGDTDGTSLSQLYGGILSVTNGYIQNLSYSTNISGTSPNFTNGSYQTLTTNNAFVWLPPSGINTYNTNVQTICIAVTNIAAAMTNMTAPANVHTKGTWWVTNVTKITWEYDPTIRSTNAYSLPLW